MLSRVGPALRSAFRPRKPPQASSSGSGSTARPPGTSPPLHNAALNPIASTRAKSKSLTPDSTRTNLWRLLNQLLVPEARTVLIQHRSSHLSNLLVRGLGRVNNVTNSVSSTLSRGVGHSQSFSLPSRVTLRQQHYGPQHTRAFGAPQYLPRGPYITIALPRGPRAIANIGLGTARNFSSGRPVFQNLVQNVPIVARALNEAGDSIDDVKRKMTVTVMKHAPVIIAGGSDAQNRSMMIKPNAGGLRTQDRKKIDAHDVWATQECAVPVSYSPFAAMGSADRQNKEFASDLQVLEKATNGDLRQVVDHETVKRFSDRPDVPPNPRVNTNADTDVDTGSQDSKIVPDYFTFSHLDLEISKRYPSSTVQSRTDDPAPVISRDNRRRTLIPEDPFVTTLLIPLALPVHLIPPRCPLPSYGHPHDLSQSFGQQERGPHATGSLHDAYTVHANRVTALLSILDEQDAWARGATCDAFDVSPPHSTFQPGAHMNNTNMQNRALRVRFEGWSEESVRNLLSASPGAQSRGVGREELNVLDWCEISSKPRRTECLVEEEIVESGMSFIMPTLDFSSTFSQNASATRQQQPVRSPLQQPNQLEGLPTPSSLWSSSLCPTPSRTSDSEDLEFDSMLSDDVTNASSNSRDSFGVESLSDRMSSAGTFDDDAFDASDEPGTEDDDDDEEAWFLPPSTPAAAASSHQGRMNESFAVDAAVLPMIGSRIAFSMSFMEHMTEASPHAAQPSP